MTCLFDLRNPLLNVFKPFSNLGRNSPDYLVLKETVNTRVMVVDMSAIECMDDIHPVTKALRFFSLSSSLSTHLAE